jgi:hypothetical protein
VLLVSTFLFFSPSFPSPSPPTGEGWGEVFSTEEGSGEVFSTEGGSGKVFNSLFNSAFILLSSAFLASNSFTFSFNSSHTSTAHPTKFSTKSQLTKFRSLISLPTFKGFLAFTNLSKLVHSSVTTNPFLSA